MYSASKLTVICVQDLATHKVACAFTTHFTLCRPSYQSLGVCAFCQGTEASTSHQGECAALHMKVYSWRRRERGKEGGREGGKEGRLCLGHFYVCMHYYVKICVLMSFNTWCCTCTYTPFVSLSLYFSLPFPSTPCPTCFSHLSLFLVSYSLAPCPLTALYCLPSHLLHPPSG